jgi:hypothetical protein
MNKPPTKTTTRPKRKQTRVRREKSEDATRGAKARLK